MTIKRMDHVTVVVEDLPAAIAFFTTLGMELEGQMPVEGLMVDRLCGLDGVKADIAMMKMPDGHGRVELTRYRSPKLVPAEPASPPPNVLGLRQVMFEVDDIDDTLARLKEHGVEQIGELVQYESSFRLCYVRGPAEIIVALAEALSPPK
jgi:catechol 2,3-dioxygenase-like lactoylglutathione lyase family enzyme